MAILAVAATAAPPAAARSCILFRALGALLRSGLANRILRFANRCLRSVGALSLPGLIALMAGRTAIIRAALPIAAPTLPALFAGAFAATAIMAFAAGMLASLGTFRAFGTFAP